MARELGRVRGRDRSRLGGRAPGCVWGPMNRAVGWAVWVEDPDHPALDDFLRSVGGES